LSFNKCEKLPTDSNAPMRISFGNDSLIRPVV
jgi:hypothetical protein